MVEQVFTWLFLFVAGGLLGILFFGGLFVTVNHMAQWRHPALVMSLSMLMRVAIVVAGFYWLTEGQWQELLAVLLGFVTVRIIMVRRFGPKSVHHAITR